MTVPSLERFLDHIVCGDSATILKDLPDETVNTVVTSPPYYRQRDYGGGIGLEPALDEYVNALLNVFFECVRVTKRDGSIFINIGDKYEDGSLLLAPYVFARKAVEKTKVKLINQITWLKPNPEPRQFKRRLVSSTEPIFHFVKDDNYKYYPEKFAIGLNAIRPQKNSGNQIGGKYFTLIDGSTLSEEQKLMAKQELREVIQEVRDGKIWSFRMKVRGIHSAAYGGYEGGRRDHIKMKGFTIIRMYDRPIKRDVIEAPILSLKYLKHPSIYPEIIVQECLNLTTQRGDVVLDPFVGSGTTAVVAKRMGRHYIGIEISNEYCEIAEDRIRKTLIEPDLIKFLV